MPVTAHLLGERRRSGAAAVCALLADELEVALERAYPLREQCLLLPLSLHRPPCDRQDQPGSISMACERERLREEAKNARKWVRSG